MSQWRKFAIVMLAVLVFGAARLPYEAGLSRELTRLGLVTANMQLGTRERIGQTSSAVALGGLRTLVATFLNLRAFTFFTEKRWADVADTFDTIVDLAPRTRYYWETGSWHAAYNAASYYLNDSKLPPLRRREAWRSSIVQGREFLERGIRNNPQDWSLYANLGALLVDANKFPAFRDANETFAAAADAYHKAAATGQALDYVRRAELYALARVAGKEHEALTLARALYAEGPQQHTPTLRVLLLVLEAHEKPQMDVARRAIELFGNPQTAYQALSAHWRRTREHFPVDGVAAGLEQLERMLAIPKDQSVLARPLAPAPTPDDWFQR